jgi:hypothetical protein
MPPTSDTSEHSSCAILFEIPKFRDIFCRGHPGANLSDTCRREHRCVDNTEFAKTMAAKEVCDNKIPKESTSLCSYSSHHIPEDTGLETSTQAHIVTQHRHLTSVSPTVVSPSVLVRMIVL